jgi:hypothetical protein
LIGAGWRGEFYLRIARDLAEHFPLTGVVEHTAKKREQALPRGGATFANVEELIAAQRPSFIVTCVPPEANLPLLESLASHHVPVLSETPIGRTLQELHRVAALAKAGARIQVAEQYHFQPMHATHLKPMCLAPTATMHPQSRQDALRTARGAIARGMGRSFLVVVGVVSTHDIKGPPVLALQQIGSESGPAAPPGTPLLIYPMGNRLAFWHARTAVALAAKNARILWALLTKGDRFIAVRA